MTVLGLGCDILKVARIESIVSRQGLGGSALTRFSRRILHQNELETFTKLRSNDDTRGVVDLLSGSWCVKEAVYKSLDHGDQEGFRFRQWFKGNDPHGRPFIGGTYLDDRPNETFVVSISHDGGIIMSTVIRQLDTPRGH